jgi:hypothetical protein
MQTSEAEAAITLAVCATTEVVPFPKPLESPMSALRAEGDAASRVSTRR